MTYGGQARCRWLVRPGRWEVRGRVERFVEPCVLLALRERPRHGYELAEAVAALAGEAAAVDAGNLYRTLRGLEAEGFVASKWRAAPGGPPRRTYALTAAGRRLLGQWSEALGRTEEVLAAFRRRHAEERSP